MHAAAWAALSSGAATPFYLYDAEQVRSSISALRRALGADVGLLYAVKANASPHVVAAAISAGAGIEAVSLGEVLLARALRAPAVLYSPSNASDEEYEAVQRIAAAAASEPPAPAPPLGAAPAVTLNVDSLSRLARMPRGSAVCLRVNGGLGGGHHAHVITAGPASKFGIAREDLPRALTLARERALRVVGLHQHIGSGILDAATFVSAAGILLAAAEAHAAQLPDLAMIDVGGGLGVPYLRGAPPLDVAALGAALSARFSQTLAALPSRPRLVLEPGRYLVAAAGLLVARVTCIKDAPDGAARAGLDTGFNHLCRPMVYGAHHEIARLGPPAAAGAGGAGRYIIVGNVCENGDSFTPAGAREMERLAEGDAVAIETAGAYGRAMASEYNMRPLPAEWVVDEAALVARWARGGEVDCGGGRAVACAARAQTAAELVAGLLSSTGGFEAAAVAVAGGCAGAAP